MSQGQSPGHGLCRQTTTLGGWRRTFASGAQGGTKGGCEGVDNRLPQPRAVLFRERARVRLERDRDRNRLLAGWDRLASVVAQEAHLAHLVAACLPRRRDQ